ncbi:MFS-type transporter SLC18B1-like isoform X2 [Symsagittifera roscoffensis]|uniref:MFS-type transporter SLC18B1-like isoform X2 n=1 Tax=Symsagittifera roscoffensis TaxID=84072 RepID=UPI00307BD3FF
MNKLFIWKLATIFLVNAIITVTSIYSAQVGLLLPMDAHEKGLTKTNVGTICGFYDGTALILGLLISKFTHLANWKTVFWVSSLFYSVAIACFGVLTFIEEKWTYIVLSVIDQIVAGAASCCIQTVMLPLMFALFPKQRGNLSAAIQEAYEAGSILGSLIGGFLFNFGGYFVPFLMTGVCGIVVTILSAFFVLPHKIQHVNETVQVNEETDLKEISSKKEKPNKLTIVGVILSYQIQLATYPNVIVSMTLGLFRVFLTPMLTEVVKVAEKKIWCFFVPAPAMALVLSPVVGILITWKYKWTIFLLSPIVGSIGSFLFCIVTFNLFLDGTAAQLVMVAGLVCFGFSFSASWVVSCVISDEIFEAFSPNDAKKEYRILMSTWNSNICYMGGRCIGNALVGGVLFDLTGFKGVILIQLFLYLSSVLAALSTYYQFRKKTKASRVLVSVTPGGNTQL